MSVDGTGTERKFSFDIYTSCTGGQSDFKVCGHSLRILYRGSELSAPAVATGMSEFYSKITASYTERWDTLGYFHLTDTAAGDMKALVVDLDPALLTGSYGAQGYTSALLPLQGSDGAQPLCRIEFDVTNDATFTLADAGVAWDARLKGSAHFDPSIDRKKVDEDCETISGSASYEVENPAATPTPTATPAAQNDALVAGAVAGMKIDLLRSVSEGYLFVLGCADDPWVKAIGSVYDNNNEFVSEGSYTEQAVALFITKDAAERITVEAGDTLEITNSAGEKMKIYLPALNSTENVTLYVGADGATYYDVDLQDTACSAPAKRPVKIDFRKAATGEPDGWYRDRGATKNEHWGQAGAREFGW